MPAVVYERQQKPVFQCRKAKVRIPAETGSSLKVNTHIAETDRGLRFSRPSKSVFDARNKLPRPKRLCNIVIRTELIWYCPAVLPDAGSVTKLYA